MIKSSRMWILEALGTLGRDQRCIQYAGQKLEGKHLLEDLSINGRTKLK
jgi:hypothetical protein